MMSAQVYGGSLSLVIGAYCWSQSQVSYCRVQDTVVSGLWMELNNIHISGSQAGTYTNGDGTYTNGGALLSRNHTFRLLQRL